MSRGRRKNSSAPAAGSATSSSRSLRWRYPASCSISQAASDRDPLLGTAMRSMGCQGLSWGAVWVSCGARAARSVFEYRGGRALEMGVDLVEADAARDHEHLQVVEQL